MLTTLKKILRLPVVTVRGVKLGVVRDVEIEIDGHHVHVYLVGNLFGQIHYRIAPSQVVSIDSEKLVVVDGVISEKIVTEETPVRGTSLSGAVAPSKKF